MLNFLYTLQTIVARRLDSKDKGATAVEYGLMVSLIAVVIITAVTLLGTRLAAIFTAVTAAL